jgi:serine protease
VPFGLFFKAYTARTVGSSIQIDAVLLALFLKTFVYLLLATAARLRIRKKNQRADEANTFEAHRIGNEFSESAESEVSMSQPNDSVARKARVFATGASVRGLAFVIGMSLAMSALAGASPESVANAKAQFYDRTDRIIVKTAPNPKGAITSAEAAELAQRMSTAAGRTLTYSHQAMRDVTILRTPAKISVAEANRIARRLSREPGVEYAEPDVRMFKALVPNDPDYAGSQWNLQNHNPPGNYGISAPAAWDITTGSASVVIAVIDTGIRPHADLAGRTVAGYDFITDVDTANDSNGRDNDPSDPGDWVTNAESTAVGGPFEGCRVENSSWHGTHVSGIAGAASNNSVGVAGVTWDAKIQPIRALGKCGGFNSDIAAAIIWAAGGAVASVPANATPAKVINLSLGGLSASCSTTMRNAVSQANALGSIVVVAAGNSQIGTAGAEPANCPGVIAVTATDKDGARASYTNVGEPATVSAPGGDFDTIRSTLNAGTTVPGADSYAGYIGTSMASPHIAGIAALMLSVRPALAQHHLAAFLRGTAASYAAFANPFYSCELTKCGDGIANAAAAVAAAQSCTVPPAGTPALLGVSCNGDYDGNGVVSTLTDGLIALRLQQGLTGTAVTEDALGTCATRTSFATIRAWSNRNCGTNY